jgi:hypothetical protein
MSLLNNEGLRVFFSGRRRFQLAWIFAISPQRWAQGTILSALGTINLFYRSKPSVLVEWVFKKRI